MSEQPQQYELVMYTGTSATPAAVSADMTSRSEHRWRVHSWHPVAHGFVVLYVRDA